MTTSCASRGDRCLAPKVPGSVGSAWSQARSLLDSADNRDGASLAPRCVSDTGVAEAAAAVGPVERVDHIPRDLFDALDHELSDSVTA